MREFGCKFSAKKRSCRAGLAQEMASSSPESLREWCRVTCARYPNVDIKNMSTSFRDGLAFCAIIHKHRPDLIDFSSLSKDNVYQNNKLAFAIAETKLGIPALLHPNDMVSTKVPDCLSVITYLSQYYHFFNRKSYAGPASLRPPHVAVLSNLTKSKNPNGLKSLKSSTDLESSSSSREDRISNTRPRTVCSLCFKPVHLIQRQLIDGKVYHRSCFRCKVCHSTLLPGSYTQGSDTGFLICTHHVTESKSSCVDLDRRVGSTENQPKCESQAGYFSLAGLAVDNVPHYTKKTESRDRPVCKTPETEEGDRQERSSEVKDGLKGTVKKPAPPDLPPTAVKDRTDKGDRKAASAPIQAESKTQEVTNTQEPSELSSPCAQATEGSSRPVPAPRRMLDSSTVPVPAPRTKTSQTMNSCPAAGNPSNQNKWPPSSSHVSSPTGGSPKVKTNHPWLAIVHPGPWTQLPPAPAPVPAPRSKSVSNPQGSWYRPKVAPPNPFGEDVDEDVQGEDTKPESSAAAVHSGNDGELTDKSGDRDATAEPHDASDEPQSHILPRSLSVPAITHSSHLPVDLTEANECDQVSSCQNKPACKENPFDRKPAMPKSKTFQALPSTRAPAPGHGFPLIKRKVQTDQNVSTEDLQVKLTQLDEHLQALEQRGVELERSLRDCDNDTDQEQMLMEWFSLVHERHVLVCRHTELVCLTKQQKLEERQADVEYEIRCLLNKPESDWTHKDRDQEQRLMGELVAIIEQRNQIISGLDQDRQREREEDMILEAMMKNKELQKEGLKELKKSKGKFKPIRVFKMLNHKAQNTKDSVDKKS